MQFVTIELKHSNPDGHGLLAGLEIMICIVYEIKSWYYDNMCKIFRTLACQTFVNINTIISEWSIDTFKANFACILIMTFVDIVTTVRSDGI